MVRNLRTKYDLILELGNNAVLIKPEAKNKRLVECTAYCKY